MPISIYISIYRLYLYLYQYIDSQWCPETLRPNKPDQDIHVFLSQILKLLNFGFCFT